MRGCCDDTDVVFTCCLTVVKGFIVGIGHPMETVWIIELEVVPAGVYGIKVNTFSKGRQRVAPLVLWIPFIIGIRVFLILP